MGFWTQNPSWMKTLLRRTDESMYRFFTAYRYLLCNERMHHAPCACCLIGVIHTMGILVRCIQIHTYTGTRNLLTHDTCLRFGSFLLCFHAVVAWQIVTLIGKYKNPTTSFEVSVSSARSVGRFQHTRTSFFRRALNSIDVQIIGL